MSYNKYHNKKVIYDGLKFDSQHEADRYCELKLMQRAGKIKNLTCQVPFSLVPPQYGDVNGKRKMLERACSYVADFTYYDEHNILTVEDAKGMRVEPYITKRKLMLYLKGIRVIEV